MKTFYFSLLSVFFGLTSLFAQTVTVQGNLGTSGLIIMGSSNYHVNESIYTAAEIGASNFTSAASAIQKVNFLVAAVGTPTNVSTFNLYMKNISSSISTLTSGTYNNRGTYQLVYSGSFNPTTTGVVGVTLSTPFIHTAGSNVQVLIERLDNTVHTGFVFNAAIGNASSATALSSRRFNGSTLPVSGTTSLTTTTFRPAIQFVYVFPNDAGVFNIISPNISCYNGPQGIGVEVSNDGLNNIAAGALNVTLKIGGANSHSATLTNTAAITPGNSEIINFTGIDLSTAGDNIDTAYVNLPGDGTTYNDTLVAYTTTATTLGINLSEYPLIEDAETSLPIFNYIDLVSGTDQLWTLQSGNYSNADQTVALVPRAPGTTFYLFDSYSGAGSAGFVSRLYSNCIQMPARDGSNPPPVTTVSFWMSHDNVFPTSLDSLYLSVSTDKGLTWTRLSPGYGRYDAAGATPFWKQEIVNISAYNGQTIQLGFEGVSQYGNIIGLDDINISYTGLAPVTLLSFDAKRSGSVNNISWTTAQEVNTSLYVVERSTDGRNFVSIGTVNANQSTVYRYTDIAPAKGVNYYRLKVVDNDNSIKYSVIKNIRNLGVADMFINPNPVQQTMKLTIEAEQAENASIVITDLSGRRVNSTNVNVAEGANNFELPVSNLAKGSYIVMVKLSNQTIVKKINKL